MIINFDRRFIISFLFSSQRISAIDSFETDQFTDQKSNDDR